MALSEDLEAVLALIQDEGDRTAQRNLLEKHQVLREGYLRQADYDRKFNQFKSEKTTLEAEKAKEHQQWTEWKEWYDRNHTVHDNLVSQYNTLLADRDDLQQQIEAARLVGEGGTVETKELIAQLAEAKKNIATVQADTQKMAREEAEKVMTTRLNEEREKFWKEAVPATVLYQAKLTNVQNKYSREYKAELDVLAFDQFMKENNLADPEKAFEQYMAPKRHEAAIVTAREEGVKFGRDEAMKSFVPGSGAGPAPEIGPLRAVLTKKSAIPDGFEIGSGALASLAGEELRSEGKF